ncbi:MAG: hypothetical protein ACFFDT_34125, partial [Candidatus Hodarchaeota archaeon]
IRKTRELIGEVAKKHLVSQWADNPAEALINTVLAVRQRWDETVVPRLKAFRRNYRNIKTIYDLKELIESMSEHDFCDKVFGMKIKETPNQRYEMLKGMVTSFIQYQKEKGFSSDSKAMKDWAYYCDLSDLKSDIIGGLPNVGLATVQNLRICLGIHTLKPDVHIKRAMEEIGLGNDVEVCALISELTGYSPLELDQIFWQWDRNRSPKDEITEEEFEKL